jgi:subtilase family serine protease
VNDDGEVLLRKRRRSAECSQAGPLPNLRVAGIEVLPGEVEGTSVYRVRVTNRGEADAEDVAVLLRVDGAVVDEAEMIKVLEPGEERTLTFNGPVCQRRLRAVVDAKDLIAEARERDNVRARRCL